MPLVNCPCGKRIRLASAAEGSIRCPACGKTLRLAQPLPSPEENRISASTSSSLRFYLAIGLGGAVLALGIFLWLFLRVPGNDVPLVQGSNERGQASGPPIEPMVPKQPDQENFGKDAGKPKPKFDTPQQEKKPVAPPKDPFPAFEIASTSPREPLENRGFTITFDLKHAGSHYLEYLPPNQSEWRRVKRETLLIDEVYGDQLFLQFRWVDAKKKTSDAMQRSWKIKPDSKHSPHALRVAAAPDGKTVYAGGNNYHFLLGGERTHPWAVEFINDFTSRGGVFNRDGRFLVACMTRGGEYALKGRGGALGPLLKGPVETYLTRYDTTSGELDFRFRVREPIHVNAIALSHDDRLLAGACGGMKDSKVGVDCIAQIWDLQTGKQVRQFVGHDLPVRGIAFDREGQRLVTGGLDGSIRVWEVATGKELHKFTYQFNRRGIWPVFDVAFHSDGRHVYASGGEGILVIDLHLPDAPTALLGTPGFYHDIQLTLSPDGKSLAAAGSYPIDLWRLEGGADKVRKLKDAPPLRFPAKSFKGHFKEVQDLDFTSDGRFLVSGSREELMLWEVADGKEVRRWGTDYRRLLSHNFENLPLPEPPWTSVLAEQFPGIRTLSIRNSLFTDAHLPELAIFPQLTGLDLSRTAITDSGLNHLTEITKLKQLDLSQTKISDAGLKSLTRLTSLRLLFLAGCDVSAEGRKTLLAALPDLQIVP